MRVHLFALCWNEEKVLPYFFRHYRERFKDIRFTIYDNYSTDASRQILLEHGAEVISYDSGNQIRGDIQKQIRNEAWKSSTADWIIVCDIDEWIECDDAFLERTNCTVVKPKGYHMVAHTTNFDNVVRGMRHHEWDKCVLFKRQAIREMNYGPGSHYCQPEGEVIYNSERIVLYHMKFTHLTTYLKKQKRAAARVSQYNKERGWSVHYYTDVKKSLAYYLVLWWKSKRVRRKREARM